jgi:hypothetical protein
MNKTKTKTTTTKKLCNFRYVHQSILGSSATLAVMRGNWHDDGVHRPTLWRRQGLAAARKTPYPESLVDLLVRYLAASKKARFLRFCEKTWRPSFT